MPIALLSNETIDKIAAGEVVEKPLNVVKELVENAIDAGATSVSIEIKGGGAELIRVTDNGSGIPHSECEKAFLRHATSKLRTIEDLLSLHSLGFRGEALSSISAVSKTEMISKTKDSLLGTHIVVEGGKLMENSEIGAPNGTTIIVRSLFYNTPARRKFLKSPMAEGAAIEDIIEKFALCNPGISFQLLLNGKTKISTSGNGNLKDVIYHIFGKDVYASLLNVDYCENGVKITGFTAKPEFSYQARNGELYFVNSRYVKSKVINTAIEEVYRNYLMQHRFPFCVLNIDVCPDSIDVNVHPQKLEVKFSDNSLISDSVINALSISFSDKELIPEVEVPLPETFYENVTESEEKLKGIPYTENPVESNIPVASNRVPEPFEENRREPVIEKLVEEPKFVQESFFEKKLINDAPIKQYRIIGQVFDTYWLITLEDDLFIVDQHAAHEKVNYETFLKAFEAEENFPGQMINPPIVLNLSPLEEQTLLNYEYVFSKLGFEIEEFGIGSYAVRSVPMNLFGISEEDLFHSLLNELSDKEGAYKPSAVCEKIASMSCKAAIKGGQHITYSEMENLMKQLMTLDNPYNCPHGRPVFIKITKTELEKKFKRIV